MPGFNYMALLPQGFLVQTPGWKLGFSTSGRATGAMTWSQDTGGWAYPPLRICWLRG